MSEPRYPSEKSVEVIATLKAYRDQAAIIGPHAKPGFSINGQVGDNHQDAMVAVAEVLNQFRRGFTEGGVPEYTETTTSWRSTGKKEPESCFVPQTR